MNQIIAPLLPANCGGTEDAPPLDQLDKTGFALLPGLLTASECAELVALHDAPSTSFRSTVDMRRYGFGSGEYRYFDYPLPPLVKDLRGRLYGPLARIANIWSARLGTQDEWPATLDEFLEMCHAKSQSRPTPLLLKYGPDDYNCLHQDLYGEIHFPLQVVVLLSQPGVDFEGGELMLVENRPRAQSRASVISLMRGDAAIIPVRDRPATGAKGWRRTTMRHGVSTVTKGSRQALGLIFHDAR